MQRKNNGRGPVLALCLGATACGLNVIAAAVEPHFSVPLGNLVLFVAAATLSPLYAAISVVLGEAFHIIVQQHFVEALRITTIVLIWNQLARKNSRFAGFPAVVGLWLAVFAPMALAAYALQVAPLHQPVLTLATTACLDLLFSLVAGVALLNQNVWVALTQRPRAFSLSQMLTQVITLVALVSLGTAFSLPELAMSTIARGHAAPNFLAFSLAFMVAVALPVFVAIRLSDLIRHASHEMFRTEFLQGSKELTFSGLSSAFWRRKDSEVTRERGSTLSDSDTRLLIQPNGNPRLSPNSGLCAVDTIGTITFTNRRFAKLVELKEREVTGKKLDAIIMNPVLKQHLLTTIAKTRIEGPQNVEVKINQLPDSLRYFEIRTERAEELEGSSLLDTNGGIIVTVRDITESRAIEAHKLQAQRLASLGNSITSIARTFQNSLSEIRDAASSGNSTALATILDSIERAEGQVQQLLQFAEGAPTLLKNFDLIEFIAQNKPLIQGMADDNHPVTLQHSVEAAGIQFDSNLLLQTIANLVINARDAYYGRPGPIEISVDIEQIQTDTPSLHPGARPGTFGRLRVKDSGAGMPPDVLAKAFDPAFTTHQSQGRSGLGLSMVFAIVRAHDGFLTIESHVGKGTTVSVYVPLVEAVRPPVVIQQHRVVLEATAHAQSPAKSSILVVEDEGEIRELIAKMLSTLGYEVQSCSCGAEALERYKAKQFDLILADFEMPQMNGTQLLEQIRALHRDAKAMLMTGRSADIQREDSSVPLLAKPFDIGTLAASVNAALLQPSQKSQGI